LQELPGKICNPLSEKLKAQKQIDVLKAEVEEVPLPLPLAE